MMLQRKKKSTMLNKNYQYAQDIGKVMQFESRLFRTLENGVVCHGPESSPDVSPEKARIKKVVPPAANPKLQTGFESGYLGDSKSIHDTSSGYGSDNENSTSTSATLKQRRTPLLKRSNSLTVLSPVPEEQESAFLQPHFINVHPPIQPVSANDESGKKEQSFARKLRFFDVRNLRLSFRKKTKDHDSKGRRSIPSAMPGSLNSIHTVVHRPTSVTYQNNCYFERPVADCVACTRLLKDPRFCECPPQARMPEQLVQTSTSFNRKGSSRYSLSATKDHSITSDQRSSLQKSIQLYGTVKRREKKKDNQDDTSEEIRKSLARFSVTPSFIEDIPYSVVNKNKQYDDSLNNNISRPKESGISIVKDFKLEFMHNKWIYDITVTRKHDLVITDLKNVYLVDKDGNLKLTIGSKGQNKLQAPNSITTDSLGNLVILDQSKQMIQVYGLKGQLLSTLEDSNVSAKSRIACNDKNQILVTSTDKRKINIHSQNNHHLYSISSSCQSSTGVNDKLQFYQPFSIAINHLTGDIIIGDDHKEMVIAMTCFGKAKWSFTPPGERNRSFYPNSICTDNNGYIFVADLYEEKIYMLDSSGKYLKTLLSRLNGLKGGPVAITTDATGHLLVSDEEKTLKIFKYGERGFALYRRFSYCPQNL